MLRLLFLLCWLGMTLSLAGAQTPSEATDEPGTTSAEIIFD